MPRLTTPEGLSDFYFIEATEPEAIQDLILRLVKERIPGRFKFDPKMDIQVLSPMNRSLLGARNLNQVLQAALNPGNDSPEIQRFGWTFRIGDRVIQTETDDNRDVFNGDLGIIEKINPIEASMPATEPRASYASASQAQDAAIVSLMGGQTKTGSAKTTSTVAAKTKGSRKNNLNKL